MQKRVVLSLSIASMLLSDTESLRQLQTFWCSPGTRRNGIYDYCSGECFRTRTASVCCAICRNCYGRILPRQRQHALVIYDDLSKAGSSHRQVLSLLARPPDARRIRAMYSISTAAFGTRCKMSDERCLLLTALPIIETPAGDVSAYIPTNVISITDGQIYLNPTFFNAKRSSGFECWYFWYLVVWQCTETKQ